MLISFLKIKKNLYFISIIIDWNQFNKLYDPDKIKKGIINADIVVYKLGLVLIRAINKKLEFANEKR